MGSLVLYLESISQLDNMKSHNSVENSFAKDAATLVTGTVISQLIIVLFSPVLTRLYTPVEFGVLAIYSSILGVVSPVLSLRYDMAIVLPGSQKRANDLVNLSLLLALLSGFFAFVLIVFLQDEVARVFGQEYGQVIQWLLVVGIILIGLHQAINFWAIRNKSYSAIAGSKFSQSFFMTSMQLTGYQYGSITLIIGQIFGQISSTIYLVYVACVRDRLVIRFSNARRIMAAARRYKKFPLYTTWSALINSAGVQLPIMLFALYFGIQSAGFYALAQRILNLPMAIIGSAIQSIFFTNIADEIRRKRAASIVVNFFSFLARLVLPPMLLVIVYAPEAFSFVFSEAWNFAGQLAQLMAIWIIFQFCTGPLTLVFAALGQNRLDFVLQAVMFSVRMGAILIGVISGSFYMTIAIFSIGSAVCYVVIFVIICRLVHASMNHVAKIFIKHFVYSLLIISPLVFADYMSSSITILLTAFMGTVVLLGMWYLDLWHTYDSIRLESRSSS